MTQDSRFFRFISAVCCGTLVALPLQNGYVISAAQGSLPASDTQMTAQFQQLLSAMRKLDAAIPKDQFDPDAVVKEVGQDPTALFQWVRDATTWVPYRGVLRGPVGVLLDRSGNDLDRALLLDQLLKTAGKQVRLAHGRLSDARSLALLNAAHPLPAPVQASSGAALPEFQALSSEFAADSTPYGQGISGLLKGLMQQEKQMSEEAVERSQREAQVLSAAIALGHPAAAASAAAAPSLDLVRDHWWVQWLNGSMWTDLDPSLPHGQPGDRETDVQDTTDPSGIDPQLYHTVRISVVVERWDQGKLAESQLLTQTLRTSDLFGIDISLAHLPIAWPAGLESMSATDATKQGRSVALNQHEWLPVLHVGRDAHSEFSFTDEGVQRTGRPGVGTTMARGFEGVASVFGDVAPHSILTAEWIDYEVTSPGQRAQKMRRPIFDRIGPAARGSKNVPQPTMTDRARRDVAATLMGQSDILILGAQLSRGFVSHLFAQRFLQDGPPILEVLSTAPDSLEAVRKISHRLTPIPGPLYDLALARSAWSADRRDVYVDRPVIISAHSAGREIAGEIVAGTYAFDIVSNDAAVRPTTKVDTMTVRLTQGIVDTTAEAVLAATMGNHAQPNQRPITNASDMLARAGDGIQWIAIRSTDDPSWQRVQLSADARAYLSEDLTAGYMVVVPDHAPVINGQPAFTWWRIDPKTGGTLGRGPDGWGESMVEYATVILGSCLCAADFVPGYMKESFASAMGLVLCFVLGGITMFAWAMDAAAVAAGAESLKGAGNVAVLGQLILGALVKVWDYVVPQGDPGGDKR